jgi:hypothetical protein
MDEQPSGYERRVQALEAEVRRLAHQIETLQERLGVHRTPQPKSPAPSAAGLESVLAASKSDDAPPGEAPPPMPAAPEAGPGAPPSAPEWILEPKAEPVAAAAGETAPISAAIPFHETVREPRPETSPKAPREASWKSGLRRINMLPPEAGGSMEVQLGAWWLTRIGALILVVGVVFFGIYVSNRLNPAMRLIKFLVIAAGMAGIGLRLERRDAQYGSVLVGGGLALLYFAAFGAYAREAMKVIDSAAWAAVWQFAAAGSIVGVALWRNSQTLATMATLCGYVACFFSFSQGFHDFALISAWMLAAGAAVLNAWRRWPMPGICALPMNYVVFAWMALVGWREAGATPVFWRAMFFPLAAMALYIRVDHRSLEQGTLPKPRLRKLLMLFNTSAAVLLALIATASYFPNQYDAFYFMFGTALLAAAWMYWQTDRNEALVHLFYLKGSALISLAVISHYDGRTRWVALAVQSLLILLSARRSRRWLHEALATATWLVSMAFYFGDLSRLARAPGELSVFSRPGIVALAYLLFCTWLIAAKSRWMAPAPDAGKPAFSPVLDTRQVLLAFWSLLTGVAALVGGVVFLQSHLYPLGLVLLATAIAAIGVRNRAWTPLLTAAVPMIAGHFYFRQTYRTFSGFGSFVYTFPGEVAQPRHVIGGLDLALNALIVVGLTLAAAAALARWWQRREEGRRPDWAIPIMGAAHALWIFAALTAVFDTVPFGVYLLLAVGLAFAIAAANARQDWPMLSELATPALAVAIYDLMQEPYGRNGLLTMARRLRETGLSMTFATVAALGAFGLAALGVAWAPLRERLRVPTPRIAHHALHTVLATIVGFEVLHALFGRTGMERYWLMTALAVSGIAVAALARRPGLTPALWAGIFYLVAAGWRFIRIAHPYGRDGSATFVWLTVFAAVAAVALAVATRRWRPDLQSPIRGGVEGGLGCLGLGMLMLLFLLQRGGLQPYITVLWGLSAIAIFCAGLAGRVRPLRIVSLAGLSLCLVRIFLVDTRSTLDRIYAFIGVGIALLAVAFLYNKYRDRIQQFDRT